MIDWSFPPELQEQYNCIIERTRRLQQEFGIKPRTIEQRYQDYIVKKAEEQRIKEELNKLKALTGQRRPLVKWKV